jgi:hypothetical protein
VGWLDSLGDLLGGLFGGGGGQAAADTGQAVTDVASNAGGMGVGDIANYASGAIEPGTGMLNYISPESDYFQSMASNPYYASTPNMADYTSFGAPAASAGTSGMLSGAYNTATEGAGKAMDWANKNPNLVKMGIGGGMAGGKMLSDYLNRPKIPSMNFPMPNNGAPAPLTPDYTPLPGTQASPLLRQQPTVKDRGGLSKQAGGMAAL